MRGIAVVHLPTTLVAQVDSSVGGKTAVNLAAGKNLAGCVHQPRAVYADTSVLATLPPEEWSAGLGEAVKTALIAGERELAEIEQAAPLLALRESAATTGLVASCVRTKARIVAADPHERGPRRALNLGHTFAHAIEHAAGYGTIPHGIAVGVGVVLALEASSAWSVSSDPALTGRVVALLGALGLPSALAQLREQWNVRLAPDELWNGLAHDKKGAAGAPEFVLVRAAGELLLGHGRDREEVREFLRVR
jgi:3-dehydroquinate synthetase